MYRTIAIIGARLIFAALFGMATVLKFTDMPGTAAYIGAQGFPVPMLLAWVAALFEIGLVGAFLTGLYFSEAALLATAYVLFLGIVFHGPTHWAANKDEFGFFVDHFALIAGLLFAAVHGPGDTMVVRKARPKH